LIDERKEKKGLESPLSRNGYSENTQRKKGEGKGIYIGKEGKGKKREPSVIDHGEKREILPPPYKGRKREN